MGFMIESTITVVACFWQDFFTVYAFEFVEYETFSLPLLQNFQPMTKLIFQDDVFTLNNKNFMNFHKFVILNKVLHNIDLYYFYKF